MARLEVGKDAGRCHLLLLLLVFGAMLRGPGPAPNQSMGQPPAHTPGSSCMGRPHFHLHPKVTPSLLPHTKSYKVTRNRAFCPTRARAGWWWWWGVGLTPAQRPRLRDTELQRQRMSQCCRPDSSTVPSSVVYRGAAGVQGPWTEPQLVGEGKATAAL